MSNPEWMHDEDELSESDLEFLRALEDETLDIKPDAIHENPAYPDREPVEGPENSPVTGPSASADDGEPVDADDGEPSDSDVREDNDENDPRNNDQEERDDEPETPPVEPHDEEDIEPEKVEPDPQSEADEENPYEPSDDDLEAYASVPEAGPRCTNHCEDNDEDASDETCPHCDERIRLERMQWGAVAVDRNNEPLLPGDRVLVVVPHPMMLHESVLAVNVPNLAIDDPRYIESTRGDTSVELCWLSGEGISSFTGWHMVGTGNSVWKFSKGTRIGFVEKIGSPKYEDFYPEQMIEDFMKDLDNQPTAKDPTEPEPEPEDTPEEPQDEVREQREKREHTRGTDLTQAQHDRFDNLVERIDKKVEITFGGTLESHELDEAIHHSDRASQTIRIVSRGVEYWVTIQAQRSDKDDDQGEAA